MDMKKPRQLRLAGVFCFKRNRPSADARSPDRFVLSKGRASPNKPQRRCCNKGAAAHTLGLAHGSARLLGMLWRVRRARCGMLGGCSACGHGTQKLTRSANTFLIFGERVARRGIDGLGGRAGHGIPLQVMNGTAPNPGEGWASTGKVENRCVTVGAAEAAHAWLAPGGETKPSHSDRGQEPMLGSHPLRTRFPHLDRFPYGTESDGAECTDGRFV